MRLARQLVALALLLADRQQTDARRGAGRARRARRRIPSPRTGRDAAAGIRRSRRESSSTAGERRVGMMVASAGRSTPGSSRTRACAAITDAPVWPALNSASARPSRTASAATRIDARGLRRSAAPRTPPSRCAPGASSDLDVERRTAPRVARRARARLPRRRRRAAARPADAARRPARRRRCWPGRRRRPWRRWRCAVQLSAVSCRMLD